MKDSGDTIMMAITPTRLRHPILMTNLCMTLTVRSTLTLNTRVSPTTPTNNITTPIPSLPRKSNPPRFPHLNHCQIHISNLRYSLKRTISHRIFDIALSTTRSPLHARSRSSIMKW